MVFSRHCPPSLSIKYLYDDCVFLCLSHVAFRLLNERHHVPRGNSIHTHMPRHTKMASYHYQYFCTYNPPACTHTLALSLAHSLFTHSPTNSLTDPFHSQSHPPTHALTRPTTHSLIHSLTHLPTHSLALSLNHSFILVLACSLIPSFTPSFIHSLLHKLAQASCSMAMQASATF